MRQLGFAKAHGFPVSWGMTFTGYLSYAAVAAVAVVLVLGLINMMRDGPKNRSQLFMRWRVGLQFVAIIVLMAALWFAGKGP